MEWFSSIALRKGDFYETIHYIHSHIQYFVAGLSDAHEPAIPITHHKPYQGGRHRTSTNASVHYSINSPNSDTDHDLRYEGEAQGVGRPALQTKACIHLRDHHGPTRSF